MMLQRWIYSQDGGCVEVLETVCGGVATMSVQCVRHTSIIEAGVRNEAVSRV